MVEIMKEIEFQELTNDEKKVLLSAFNFVVDERGFIYDALLNEKVVSKANGKPFTINNVAMITGSLHLINSDPVSLSRYIREELENES